jgi:hypothetical protein
MKSQYPSYSTTTGRRSISCMLLFSEAARSKRLSGSWQCRSSGSPIRCSSNGAGARRTQGFHLEGAEGVPAVEEPGSAGSGAGKTGRGSHHVPSRRCAFYIARSLHAHGPTPRTVLAGLRGDAAGKSSLSDLACARHEHKSHRRAIPRDQMLRLCSTFFIARRASARLATLRSRAT